LEELIESFSFGEVKKRSQVAKYRTVLCESITGKTTLLETGGVILPLERHTIYVSFAPMTDDTARTAMPKALRLALIHHKNYFFKGVLTLQVASSIPAPPGYIFQAVLFTLLSMEQMDKVPMPTERPRQGAYVITSLRVLPHGHAPWHAPWHAPCQCSCGKRRRMIKTTIDPYPGSSHSSQKGWTRLLGS
jgi:hypothetical protein